MSVSLQITRSISTTLCLMTRRLTKRSNPGLGHQVADLEDAAEVIQSDPEGFGGLESDLMDAHKTHKQHEFEMRQQKEKIRQFMVKKKYFRDVPMPNLLTYAEKEQIRILNSRDPEEWSVERLTESFPANSEIIRKILKANWKPMSIKRIHSHDAGAFSNWELYKKGELNQKLSPEFREHLKKFADRRAEDLKNLPDPAKVLSKPKWQKPQCTEFSSIISLRAKQEGIKSPKALTEGISKNNTDSFLQGINNEDETYLMGKVQNRKQMRIQELKESKLLTYDDIAISPDDKAKSIEHRAALELNNVNGTGIVKNSTSQMSAFDYTEKFASNEVVISERDKQRFEMSTVKDRIHIPRKLWQKGATYRVDDCYYDDDGEFLYRVPGMTSG